MKATAVAPSNIAFIKYWGKKDEELKLPTNGSISMDLSNLLTVTTVEFDPDLKEDMVMINGIKNSSEQSRVVKHLDLIRKMALNTFKAKVLSMSNFPVGTGLSSSASGFAALTIAAVNALGIDLDEKKLSILARIGSGSASRSIPDGFVEWKMGKDSNSSYSISILPPNYFKILDVVAIVSNKKKEVSTTDGQKLAHTSPLFKKRLLNINKKIEEIKKLIKNKDFKNFGQLVEDEAIELHKIMQTSKPPLNYLQPETIKIMELVKKWRSEGLEVYFTLNTGQDIHLIIEEKNKEKLVEKLKEIDIVKNIIVNKPAVGARLIKNHLF
jgi:diphosphomevalonate decarboxylase